MPIEFKNARGTKSPAAKLTADQVREIRKLAADGALDVDLAKRFGIDRTQIRRIRLFQAYFDVE